MSSVEYTQRSCQHCGASAALSIGDTHFTTCWVSPLTSTLRLEEENTSIWGEGPVSDKNGRFFPKKQGFSLSFRILIYSGKHGRTQCGIRVCVLGGSKIGCVTNKFLFFEKLRLKMSGSFEGRADSTQRRKENAERTVTSAGCWEPWGIFAIWPAISKGWRQALWSTSIHIFWFDIVMVWSRSIPGLLEIFWTHPLRDTPG